MTEVGHYDSAGTDGLFDGLLPEVPSTEARARVLAGAAVVAAAARRRRRRARWSVLGVAAGAALAAGLWLGVQPFEPAGPLTSGAPGRAPSAPVHQAPVPDLERAAPPAVSVPATVDPARRDALDDLRAELEGIHELYQRIPLERSEERRVIAGRLRELTERFEALEAAVAAGTGPSPASRSPDPSRPSPVFDRGSK